MSGTIAIAHVPLVVIATAAVLGRALSINLLHLSFQHLSPERPGFVLQLNIVTGTLATAHVPLVVIASAAAAASGTLPKVTQVGDVAGVLTVRFLGGLLAAALATFVAGREWTTFIGACAICSLAPVPSAVRGVTCFLSTVHAVFLCLQLLSLSLPHGWCVCLSVSISGRGFALLCGREGVDNII